MKKVEKIEKLILEMIREGFTVNEMAQEIVKLCKKKTHRHK